MGKDIELAILFADVVGSTRLYEQMGDVFFFVALPVLLGLAGIFARLKRKPIKTL